MSHVSEGQLQAYLDDELTAAERSTVQSHVESCAVCAADLQALKSVNAEVHAALALVEHPVPATKAPSKTIEFAPARQSLVRDIPRQFLRAAVVLLALAGVVSAAIPGSLVNRWIGSIFSDKAETPRAPAPSPAPAPPPVVAQPPEPVDLFVTPENGRITFVLLNPSADAEVHVKLVDSDTGTFQHTDATLRPAKSGGRLTVPNLGPGIITIQIPRSAATASVEVDGKTWWHREGGALQVTGPVYTRQGDNEVVFRIRS